MSILDIPWQAWATALSLLAIAVCPLVIFQRYLNRQVAVLRYDIERRIEERRTAYALRWTRLITYDLPQNETGAALIRSALDRVLDLPARLTVEQIHALCDTADKMRAENAKDNGDDNAS